MAGIRFLTAGTFLFLWEWIVKKERPAPLHWRSAFIIGGLLLLGGNGLVVIAERVVPSGITALLVSTVPLWMVFFDWMRTKGARLNGVIVFGLFAGLF